MRPRDGVSSYLLGLSAPGNGAGLPALSSTVSGKGTLVALVATFAWTAAFLFTTRAGRAADGDRPARLGVFADFVAVLRLVAGAGRVAFIVVFLADDRGFLRGLALFLLAAAGVLRSAAVRRSVVVFPRLGAAARPVFFFLRRFSILRISFSILLRRFSSLFFLFSSLVLTFIVDGTAPPLPPP